MRKLLPSSAACGVAGLLLVHCGQAASDGGAIGDGGIGAEGGGDDGALPRDAGTIDAGSDAPTDARPPHEGGTPGQIACGPSASCSAPAQACCAAAEDAATCTTDLASCGGSGDVFLRCDGPEDCAAGGTCCMTSSLFYSMCYAAACDAVGGIWGTTMCHDPADCPSSAPNCCPRYSAWSSWPSYRICSPVSDATCDGS